MRSRPYFSLSKLSIVEWCLRIIDHFYFTYTFLWQRCLLFSSWVRCGTYCWQICTISNNCKHTGSVDLIFCNEGQCKLICKKLRPVNVVFFLQKMSLACIERGVSLKTFVTLQRLWILVVLSDYFHPGFSRFDSFDDTNGIYSDYPPYPGGMM